MADLQDLLDLLPSGTPAAISAEDMRTIVTELWNKTQAHEDNVTNPHTVTAAQAGAEPDLGNPSTDGDLLTSDADGTRQWISEYALPKPLGWLREDNYESGPEPYALPLVPVPYTNWTSEGDYNGMIVDQVAGTITIPVSGFYLVNVHMDWDPQDSGTYRADLFVNGVESNWLGSSTFNFFNIERQIGSASIFGWTNAGDVIDFRMWREGGAVTADIYEIDLRIVYLTHDDGTT